MPKYNNSENNNESYSDKNLSGFKQWLNDMGICIDEYENVDVNININPILDILDAGIKDFNKESVKKEVEQNITLNVSTQMIYKIAFLSNAFKEFQNMIKVYEEEMRAREEQGINQHRMDNNMQVNNNEIEENNHDNNEGADIIDFQKFFDEKNNN